MAAKAMGAKRKSTLWCYLALIGSAILYSIGTTVPVIGQIVAFLLSSLGFAAILGTNFIRGIGIHVLTVIFSIIFFGLIFVLLVFVFGVNLAFFPFI
jgi:hypothetical protein